MSDKKLFQDIGLHLFKNGFEVMPVKGKAPNILNWQNISINEQQVKNWSSSEMGKCNIGIRTGQGPIAVYGIDLDIYDEKVVKKVSEAFQKSFGTTLLRTGQEPKQLLIYRGKAGHTKMSVTWDGATIEGSPTKNGKPRNSGIEILGLGQQFVGYGIHPETNKPYQWPNGGIDTRDIQSLSEIDINQVAVWLSDELPKIIPVEWRIAGDRNTQSKLNTDSEGTFTEKEKQSISAFNTEYLKKMDLWVPKLGYPVERYDDYWRIRGANLPGGYEEDYSFHRLGITDFRVADQGDPNQGKRTPTTAVAELVFKDIKKWREARDWLRVNCGTERFNQGGAFGINDIEMALFHNPTQDNVALAIKHRYTGHFKFCHVYGHWLVWNGKYWEENKTGLIHFSIREMARLANSQGKPSLSTANFASGVEIFCKNDPVFSVRGDEFDGDNYLLNTPIGTYDLRRDLMRCHDQSDLLTKMTLVAPTKDGGERFRQFLEEVTGNDSELIHFLKISLGSLLSGAIESHYLILWIGQGRNGKNTLGDLIMWILGAYARKIPSTTLMASKHERHPTELASLKGIRLAVSSEISDGAFWNEARINELTGDSLISARYMGGDPFEFPRTHKHLIYGNNRPQLRSVGDSTKARLILVPFKQSFIGREDPLLTEKLKKEAGYILNWLIEGHALWIGNNRKLPICAAVDAEKADYFLSQSTIDNWVAERCKCIERDERTNKQIEPASALYESYTRWKNQRGEMPVSQQRWGETMATSFQKERMSKGIFYRGIRLKTEFEIENESI